MAMQQPFVEVDLGFKAGLVRVRYVTADQYYQMQGKRFIVYWPSGVAPSHQQKVETVLATSHAQVLYENDKDDVIWFASDKRIYAQEGDKVRQAKKLVKEMLAVQPRLDGAGLLCTAIDNQAVTFFTGNLTAWAQLLAAADAAARGKPKDVSPLNPNALDRASKTEAVTSGPRIGERIVTMNCVDGNRASPGYTLPTIVHELFHSIETEHLTAPVGANERGSPIELSGPQVEAITEYFARLATGLDERTGARGGDAYYAELRSLREPMGRGRITHEMLVMAYFLGDREAIRAVATGWYA